MVSEVISWLEECLPEIKRTRDPQGVMLKFARTQNLPPALLEKLAQVYNTAKSLNFLQKAANRGDTFQIVDADALMRQYVSAAPAAKAADAHRVNEWIDAPRGTKSAGVAVKVADRFLATERTALQAVLDQPEISSMDAKRASRRTGVSEYEATEISREAYGQVLYDLKETAAEKSASMAERIRVTPEFDFQAFESDALYLTNGAVKEACDHLARRLTWKNFPHKRASEKGTRRLVRDELGLMDGLQELQSTIEQVKIAQALQADFDQKAQATRALPRQTAVPAAGGPSGLARQPAPIAPTEKAAPEGEPSEKSPAADGKGSGGGLAGLIQNITVPKSPLQPGGMIRSLVEQALPTRNTGQETVDKDFEDLQSKVVIERLLRLDPILSEADPHMVASLANSIRSTSPSIARDYNAMRFALREAVQYNALPTHTVKDLAGVESNRGSIEQTDRANARDKYQMGVKPKAKAA